MSYKKITFILFLGIFLLGERNINAQTLTFNYTGAVQTWTVPSCVFSATVTATGAQGGLSGGLGASIMGVVSVAPGQVIDVMVGQAGGTNNEGSGGGGSFVWNSINDTLLIAAAGGGGSYQGGAGGAGSATRISTIGTGPNGSVPGGVGGNGGQGGSCATYAGGGGGTGWLTSGQAGGSCGGYVGGGGGNTPNLGGAGGGSNVANGCTYSLPGGYGGGGASTCYASGGGGGYNGGGGAIAFQAGGNGGGGGGSYNSGINQVNTGGVNSGNGLVILTYGGSLSMNAIIISNDSCRGSSNGSAWAQVIGGASPFTYVWSPVGGSGDTAKGLQASIYTVTVFSACGGSASAIVNITQPNLLGSQAIATHNITCHGGSDGIATANGLGGASPFTYAWTPVASTNQVLGGLSAGTYTVKIRDACQQSSTASVTLTQPPVLASVSAAVLTNVACFGGNTGSAAVTNVTGGGLPYTYTWLPAGGNGTTALNLTAGVYTVKVQDVCGASVSASVTITQPATAVAVTALSTGNIPCFGGSGGSASSTPSGGTAPYGYSWSNGQVTQNAVNLVAGSYIITVTDAHGCTATASVNITQPPQLTITAAVFSNIACRGQATGAINSTPGGGTGAYTYVWSNGQTTQNIAGITAGTYTVTVKDANGCTASALATVTQPNALAVVASVLVNEPCNGNALGKTNSTVSGGTGPYAYVWTLGGQTTAAATGLSAGSYTITITDNCGATVSAAVTITQPVVLGVTASTTNNVSCNGGNNGVASSAVTGGTGPYIYIWTPSGGSLATATGLSIGTYAIKVTDANGCSATASTSITQPTVVVVTATTSGNVLCNGGNNGKGFSTVSGGVGPYTYAWSPSGGSLPTVSGLVAGTYTVNVKDNHGCTGTASITITQPKVLTIAASTVANVICNGGNDGQATSVTAGGTIPYTYLWTPGGQATATANNLSIGTYTVTVWDINGCTNTASTTVTQPIALIVSAGTPLNVLCHGGSTGVAAAYVSGGPAPYTYAWTPGGQTGNQAGGLSIGTYTVNVTDIDGCTGSASTSITEPTAVAIQLDAVPDDGQCSGSAWLTVGGGVSPYSYLWSNGNTTFIIANQCTGNYCCVVTDANGCEDNVCTNIWTYAGVNNITSNGGKINVYPNPNSGQFTIESSGIGGTSTVEIYNILGGKVYTTGLDANKGGATTVDISNQPNGIYLYRVISNENGTLLGEGKIVLQK